MLVRCDVSRWHDVSHATSLTFHTDERVLQVDRLLTSASHWTTKLYSCQTRDSYEEATFEKLN